MQIDTSWYYDQSWEANRILQTCVGVLNGFFISRGNIPLPRLIPADGRIVYLPNLPYSKIDDYWDQLKQCDGLSLFEDTSHPLRQPIQDLLASYKQAREPVNYEEIKQSWEKISDSFWQTIEHIFPQIEGTNIHLHIIPTVYGNRTSFRVISSDDDGQQEIWVWYRVDMPLGQLAEGIVSALLVNNMRHTGYSWEESLSFIDTLFEMTLLHDLFPDYSPHASRVRQPGQSDLIKESHQYLHDLGMDERTSWHIMDGNIYWGDEQIVGLDTVENKIMLHLITNHHDVTTIDDLAQVIWGKDNQKYSEIEIIKHIQDLKSKLRDVGLSSEVIQVQRGRGYMLVG